MPKTKKKNTDDYPSVSTYLLKTKLVSDRLKEYAVTTDETNEVSENNVPEDFRSQQIDRVNESNRVRDLEQRLQISENNLKLAKKMLQKTNEINIEKNKIFRKEK